MLRPPALSSAPRCLAPHKPVPVEPLQEPAPRCPGQTRSGVLWALTAEPPLRHVLQNQACNRRWSHPEEPGENSARRHTKPAHGVHSYSSCAPPGGLWNSIQLVQNCGHPGGSLLAHRTGLDTLRECLQVVDFQVSRLAQNRHIAAEFGLFPQYLRQNKPSGRIHLYFQPVETRLLHVVLHIGPGAICRQPFLDLLPFAEGPDLGARAIRAGHVELGDLHPVDGLFHRDGELDSARLLDLGLMVSAKHRFASCLLAPDSPIASDSLPSPAWSGCLSRFPIPPGAPIPCCWREIRVKLQGKQLVLEAKTEF